MVDDLKSMVGGMSATNLQEGFQSTPLRKFTGVLQDFVPERDTRWEKPRTIVHYQFTDVEVHESTEPYPFPIADIQIPFSNKGKSQTGILIRSMAKLCGEQATITGNLVGKKQTWALTPGHMLFDNTAETKESPRSCWEVIAVEGVSEAQASTPDEEVLRLIDGKTAQEFNQDFYSSQVVKSSPMLLAQHAGNVLIPTLKAQGKITEDEQGRFHRVQ
jgi:hypothetical protein